MLLLILYDIIETAFLERNTIKQHEKHAKLEHFQRSVQSVSSTQSHGMG